MFLKRNLLLLFFSVSVFCNSISLLGLSVIIEPENGVKPVLNLINHAEKTIKISIYQIVGHSGLGNSPILKALAAAKKRKLKIRLILNNFKNNKRPKSGKKYLERAVKWCMNNNIKYRLSSKAFSYTHNKYMILDDNKAVIMTGNLAADDFPPKGNGRNFMIVDDNKNRVNYLRKLFDTDWGNAINNTEYTPSGKPDELLINPNNGYSVRRIADEINKSEKNLDIYMMYFYESSPRRIIKAIKRAAHRGVKVRILCSSIQDKYVFRRKFAKKRDGKYIYPENLKFIIGTEKTALPFIHAKVFIIDRKKTILGSMNMSYTSLYRNREVDICLKKMEIVGKIQKTFDSDWEKFSNNY